MMRNPFQLRFFKVLETGLDSCSRGHFSKAPIIKTNETLAKVGDEWKIGSKNANDIFVLLIHPGNLT